MGFSDREEPREMKVLQLEVRPVGIKLRKQRVMCGALVMFAVTRNMDIFNNNRSTHSHAENFIIFKIQPAIV
jgi:hypothetical protein